MLQEQVRVGLALTFEREGMPLGDLLAGDEPGLPVGDPVCHGRGALAIPRPGGDLAPLAVEGRAGRVFPMPDQVIVEIRRLGGIVVRELRDGDFRPHGIGRRPRPRDADVDRLTPHRGELIIIGGDHQLGVGVFRPDHLGHGEQIPRVERDHDRQPGRLVQARRRGESFGDDELVARRRAARNAGVAALDVAAAQEPLGAVLADELEAGERPVAMDRGDEHALVFLEAARPDSLGEQVGMVRPGCRGVTPDPCRLPHRLGRRLLVRLPGLVPGLIDRRAVPFRDCRRLARAPILLDVPLPAAEQTEADLAALMGRQHLEAVKPVDPVLGAGSEAVEATVGDDLIGRRQPVLADGGGEIGEDRGHDIIGEAG